jgi:hypothetical protein
VHRRRPPASPRALVHQPILAAAPARTSPARGDPVSPAQSENQPVKLKPGEQIIFEGHPPWRGLLSFYLGGVAAAARHAPSVFSNGETRNRTGDTTIFGRARRPAQGWAESLEVMRIAARTPHSRDVRSSRMFRPARANDRRRRRPPAATPPQRRRTDRSRRGRRTGNTPPRRRNQSVIRLHLTDKGARQLEGLSELHLEELAHLAPKG